MLPVRATKLVDGGEERLRVAADDAKRHILLAGALDATAKDHTLHGLASPQLDFAHLEVLLAAEESGPRKEWRSVALNVAELGGSISGDPSTLRFHIGDVAFKPFYETYGHYSVYLKVHRSGGTSSPAPEEDGLPP